MPECSEVAKSQYFRLWDVFALGPFLIYYGTQTKRMGALSILLIVAGALTIAYNLQNYRATADANKAAPAP
jgi:hypothetical protein